MKISNPKKIREIEEIFQDFLAKIHKLELEKNSLKKKLQKKVDKAGIQKIINKIKNS